MGETFFFFRMSKIDKILLKFGIFVFVINVLICNIISITDICIYEK